MSPLVSPNSRGKSPVRTMRLMGLSALCRVLAATVAITAVTATVSEPAQAQPAQQKQATDLFKQGTTLYQQKNFAAALEKFRASYALVPSPNSSLYIARCMAELGQVKEAHAQFRKTVAEAEARVGAEPKYQPTLDTARRELEELNNRLSFVTIQVRNPQPGTTLRIGTQNIPREQWGQPIMVDPGSVDVVLETPGAAPIVQRHSLRGGERKTVDISPQSVNVGGNLPPPGPRQDEGGDMGVLLPLAITFGAVGVVGMGMFGVAGGMSLSTYSEVEDNCPNGPACSNELIDRGEREQLIANIGVIIGGVGLAAGATFLIVDLATGGPSSEAKGPVNLAIGPGYVGVDGTF